MFNQLKLFFSVAKNFYSYSNYINNSFLDYSLRHNKIIGWFKGQPVYSVVLAPGFSKPLANGLSRRLMSQLIDAPLPSVAHVAVTDICNARCKHCSFYNNAMHRPNKENITTEQMKKILRDCQDFGVNVINFVGGEPLLNKDLPMLIKSLNKDRSVSSIYTNGWFLKEKAKELRDAGTMMAIVSIDSTNPKKHDEFRRLPGLFHRAIIGIKECQKIGLLTGISTTLVQEDLENGNFENMIQFAKKMKVNELIVYDSMPVGMYSHREDLIKNRIDFERLFKIVDFYNKKKDYPGIFCYAHFRSPSTYGCSAGKTYFYVTPYGELCPCEFNSTRVGNLLETPLPILWKKLSNLRELASSGYINSCCDHSPPQK